MPPAIDTVNPDQPTRVLMIASNPTVSGQTGEPIGAWAEEVTNPWYELTGAGFEVDIASPDGGRVEFDPWSDPSHPSGYSAHDLISLGFIHSRERMKLLQDTVPLAEVDAGGYDAIYLAGGQGPMYTFAHNPALHAFVADFYETGRLTVIVCHATSVLLKTRLSNGALLVDGKTWTGYCNDEEAFADETAGRQVQPFHIEDEARKLPTTNYVHVGRFKPFALRDGHLITAQQQYSTVAAARLMINALGGT